MKKFNKPALYLSALSVFAFAAILSSCSKDVAGARANATDVAASANVKVINTVSGSAAQNLHINGTIYGGTGITYGESSSYYTAPSGSYNATFTDAGSATVNAQFTATIAPGNYYSVYYATNDTVKTAIVVQNDQTAPAAGMAKVRFINLSSAIVAGVDFGTSATTKLATGLAYKAVSAYNDVAANTTFYVYAAGSLSAALSIPASVQAGKIYTIYITGTTTVNISYFIVAEN